ncbi:hypothetical protein V5799_020384 [Amblyomma americanum]|uniref:Uncharacterized protein n=1 Tax=Amblyomma americanum TaxID=6943 RepID=A0AAQ4EUI5_AMBAM
MSEREMYQCSDQEQGDMMRSYVCMSSSQETSCLEWRPQRLCLSSESNRFGSEEECQKACQGANEGKCGRAALCECTKFYRKMNYVFDVRRQRCRLVALHECVEAEVGFPDEDSCKAACSNGER